MRAHELLATRRLCRPLLVVVLLMASAGVATCQNAAQFSSYRANKRYDFNLSQQMLEATPTWDQYQDNPPLSPRKALQAAGDYMKVLFPDGDLWEVSQISLQPVRDRWVYLIAFLGPIPKGYAEYMQSPVTLVVTMDGVAVPAVISEWHVPSSGGQSSPDH